MALVIPPGFAQASVIMLADGDTEPYECTFGVNSGGAGGDYQELANEVMAAWVATFIHAQWTGLTIERVDLEVGQDPPPNLTATSSSPPVSGDVTADFLPQNCALLVKKLSAVGGRAGRGRMFIPLILASSEVNNIGQIDPGVVDDRQADATDFLANLDAAADTPGMWILHSDTAPTLPDPTRVTSLLVQSVIATQRRRLR